ncbi:hypothetical protein [Streptomyces sp. NPDC058664]|uniref:hypothetical protein n=1 Tax=unclassified Streptomyces TaxID=2593676 RepID=UPI0036576DAF
MTERRHGPRILTEHRDQIVGTLRRPPSARGLTDAWARTTEAGRTAGSLASQAFTAARQVERARARAVVPRHEEEALDLLMEDLGRGRTAGPPGAYGHPARKWAFSFSVSTRRKWS